MWSCSSSKSLSTAESSIAENSKISAVLWQQTSAEYDALCYQAFNVATHRLNSGDMGNMDVNSKKLAIIMDLDETVLNNSPFNGWLIHNNKTYSPANWMEWSSLAKAEFVPGAIEFMQIAMNQGFKIFFISNRTVQELDFTIANLEKAGIIVNPPDVMLKTNSSSKAERRENVLSNYRVYMLIGDNLADFHNIFENDLSISERKNNALKFRNKFGSKFIVLPNTMYGGWEKALKNSNSDYIQNSNSNGLKKYIKGF